MIQNGLLRDCPVTTGDVKRSHIIYGPPIPPLKGRTRHEESRRVKERMVIQLPRKMYEEMKNVTLCVDFFYVNGIQILHTISRRLNYRTSTFPATTSKHSFIDKIKKVKQRYHSRGFRITDMHADNEFEKIRHDVLPTRLECCGVDDHVPEIERSIQTIKNETRSSCNAMPYRCVYDQGNCQDSK